MEPTEHETLQPYPAVDTEKPARKDPYAGFDLELSRRPGYNSQRGIKPWPNSRWPIDRQQKSVPVFMHGRSNKEFPPVFGTDAPPAGLSGLIRKIAYGYPDHLVRHWLMLLAADRVDSMEFRVKKMLPFAIPALVVGLVAQAISKD